MLIEALCFVALVLALVSCLNKDLMKVEVGLFYFWFYVCSVVVLD